MNNLILFIVTFCTWQQIKEGEGEAAQAQYPVRQRIAKGLPASLRQYRQITFRPNVTSGFFCQNRVYYRSF